MFQTLPDDILMTAQPSSLPLPATLQEMRVQCFKAVEHRNRHKKVAPRVAHQTLNFAFVVTLARTAKAIGEQVVRLQFAEHTCALTVAIAEDAGNGKLGVVIEDRLRHTTKEVEGFDVPIAERLCRLSRIGHDKDRIGMGQMHRQEVDFA